MKNTVPKCFLTPYENAGVVRTLRYPMDSYAKSPKIPQQQQRQKHNSFRGAVKKDDKPLRSRMIGNACSQRNLDY